MHATIPMPLCPASPTPGAALWGTVAQPPGRRAVASLAVLRAGLPAVRCYCILPWGSTRLGSNARRRRGARSRGTPGAACRQSPARDGKEGGELTTRCGAEAEMGQGTPVGLPMRASNYYYLHVACLRCQDEERAHTPLQHWHRMADCFLKRHAAHCARLQQAGQSKVESGSLERPTSLPRRQPSSCGRRSCWSTHPPGRWLRR